MKKDERELRENVSQEIKNLSQKIISINRIPKSVVNGDAIRAANWKEMIIPARAEANKAIRRKFFKGQIEDLQKRKDELARLCEVLCE